MKKFLSLLCVLLIGQVCFADMYNFETKQQAYDRQSNENYNTYRNNNYQAPLGGYNRPLNDDGGRTYGINNNQNFSNMNNGSYNNNRNGYSYY